MSSDHGPNSADCLSAEADETLELQPIRSGVRNFPQTVAAMDRPQQVASSDATALGELFDRSLHAAVARLTGGLSPAALALAYLDWAIHLAYAPGKRLRLVDAGFRKAMRFASYVCRYAIEGSQTQSSIEPLPQDRRFVGEAWQKWPFNFIHQSFLLQQQWWHSATTGISGVSKHHEKMVEFMARQASTS
jgi:polyhydroxyalkanoate synthase subunit PhaC